MGYARDFVGAMESVLPAVVERGVRVIANAGGVNPPACARRGARRRARSAARAGKVRIGVVTGDDLLPRLDELIARGHALAQHGHRRAARRPCATACCRPTPTSAPTPIVEALARGAQRRHHRPLDRHRAHDGAAAPRVRLGRDDWDRLAAGIIAGHIIECGAQCSGGNCLYDWRNDSRPRQRRLSDRRGARRRHVRRHQAPGHGRARHRAVGHRAARLRDGRSARVHHARRRRRLHDDSRSRTTARIACASSASRGGRRPTSSRCRSPIAPASRRSARWSTPGPTRSRRRSSPIACCASGSTDSGCEFEQILTEFVGVIGDARPARRRAARDAAGSAAAHRRARRRTARRSSDSRARSRRSC